MSTFIPDKIVINFPHTITITQPYLCMLFWWIGTFLLVLFLKSFKKLPNLKESIAAALSILIMYMACVLIYKYKPAGLNDYLVLPLPFLDIQEDNLSLIVQPFAREHFPQFCSQILSLLVLAFLVNQVYYFKPDNLKTPAWLIFRFFSTMICIGVHYAVYKVLQKCLGYIPQEGGWESLRVFFPIGLLCFLVFLFLLGSIKKLMTIFFKKVNPTFEGLSGFFYVNKFGIIVTRAILTTLILTLFASDLQHVCEKVYGTVTIPMSFFILPHGLVILGAMVFLWIIVGFLL